MDLPEPDVQRRPVCVHPAGYGAHPAGELRCGIDAITGDEMRSILEEGGKLYTQLKIDDISNLGAVKIRIRSLMAAIEARKAN